MKGVKMKEPLISVLIPVYNAESFISKCLDSVLCQTYTNIEVICLDDGSKDNSLAILTEYQKKDNRIKIISRENRGEDSTRKELIDNVSGDFFVFVDIDDWIEKDLIETAFNVMRKENVDLVEYNTNTIMLGNRKTDFSVKKFGKFTSKDYINHYRAIVWNKLYRIDIIRKYKVNFLNRNDILCGFDKWFNFEYISVCKNVCVIPNRLYNYVIHNMSALSNMSDEKCLSDFVAMNECYSFLNKNDLLKKYYKPFFHLVCKLSSKLNKGDGYYLKAKQQIEILSKNLRKDYPMYFIYYLVKKYLSLKNIFGMQGSKCGKYRIITLLGIKFRIKKC